MTIKQAEIATELVRAIDDTNEKMSNCSLVIAEKQAELVHHAKNLAIMEQDLENL